MSPVTHCAATFLWTALMCVLPVGCFVTGEKSALDNTKTVHPQKSRQVFAFLEQHVDDRDGENLLNKIDDEKPKDILQASESWIDVLDKSEDPSRRALIMYFIALGGDNRGLQMLVSSLTGCRNEDLALEISGYLAGLIRTRNEILPLDWFMVNDLWPGQNISWGQVLALYWKEYWLKNHSRLQFDDGRWVELEFVPES